MNPLILVAALGIGAIALASAAKGQAKPTGGTVPKTPTGGIDVGQLLADAYNAMGSAGLTPEQHQRIKDALTAMGVDGNGNLTTRPSPQSIANLALLANQLKAEDAPMVVWTTLLALSTAAAGLPQGATTMSGTWEHEPWQKIQGPWQYLGGMTQRNRDYQASVLQDEDHIGTYTDISGFSDWWDAFTEKWAAKWWRR